MTEFITVDNPTELPDTPFMQCTEQWEVEKFYPDAEKAYSFTSASGFGPVYYVPVMED